MVNVTLKSSGINGGVAVNLHGVSITYGWKNNVFTPEIPSKFSAAADAQTTTDFLGWTNPLITIRGIFDMNTTISNGLTLALLKSFTTEKVNPVYIYDGVLWSVADTVKVQITGFDITRTKSEDVNEGKMNYSISLVETI